MKVSNQKAKELATASQNNQLSPCWNLFYADYCPVSNPLALLQQPPLWMYS